jgi:thiol:disulfide interchange protein DsbA
MMNALLQRGFTCVWLVCISMLGGWPVSARAQGDPPRYVSGRHFQPIKPPQPVATPGKLEVIEVFWYGCPHCYDFEPYIDRWQAGKPSDVELRRMPAVFRKEWQVHARAYYAAEALGVLDKVHAALFKALHEEKHRLGDEASLAAFFGEHGVKPEDFSGAFNSFAVEGKVTQAMQLVPKYGVTGVPAVVVNGKYLTSASMAGSFDETLKVIDFLLDLERTGAK